MGYSVCQKCFAKIPEGSFSCDCEVSHELNLNCNKEAQPKYLSIATSQAVDYHEIAQRSKKGDEGCADFLTLAKKLAAGIQPLQKPKI